MRLARELRSSGGGGAAGGNGDFSHSSGFTQAGGGFQSSPARPTTSHGHGQGGRNPAHHLQLGRNLLGAANTSAHSSQASANNLGGQPYASPAAFDNESSFDGPSFVTSPPKNANEPGRPSVVPPINAAAAARLEHTRAALKEARARIAQLEAERIAGGGEDDDDDEGRASAAAELAIELATLREKTETMSRQLENMERQRDAATSAVKRAREQAERAEARVQAGEQREGHGADDL